MRRQLTDAELQVTLDAIQRHNGNKVHAAAELGISRGAVCHRLGVMQSRMLPKTPDPSKPIIPNLPDDDVPVEEIIHMMSRRFEKRKTYADQLAWLPIKMTSNDPFLVAFMGDPHLDDDGCNWPLLTSHIKLLASIKNAYAVNIGDTTNNWAGRLLKEFSNQETSQKTARKLARWFLKDSGIFWLLWILGNHDAWNDGAALLKEMNIMAKTVMVDWQAKFKLVYPNGSETKIWAAHDFPGHSQDNSLHGLQKAANRREAADIYVSGHRHNWGMKFEESAGRNFTYWLLRARGYKYLDKWADTHGYDSQQYGATMCAVINPNETNETRRIQCYADLELAVSFLEHLQNR